jgi:hypothetical protein
MTRSRPTPCASSTASGCGAGSAWGAAWRASSARFRSASRTLRAALRRIAPGFALPVLLALRADPAQREQVDTALQ